jgi:antitoxin CcdA
MMSRLDQQQSVSMASELFDPRARKKPTNLSINEDLLRRARNLGVNLSELLEERLAEVLRSSERGSWLVENESAIENYNKRIEQNGIFSEGLRRF